MIQSLIHAVTRNLINKSSCCQQTPALVKPGFASSIHSTLAARRAQCPLPCPFHTWMLQGSMEDVCGPCSRLFPRAWWVLLCVVHAYLSTEGRNCTAGCLENLTSYLKLSIRGFAALEAIGLILGTVSVGGLRQFPGTEKYLDPTMQVAEINRKWTTIVDNY